MVFENGVKNIQAAAYNGARTVNNLYVLSNKAVGPGKKSKINKLRAYVYFGG